MDEIGRDELLKLKRKVLKAKLLGLPLPLSEEEKEAIKKWEILEKVKEDENNRKESEAITQWRHQYSLDINEIELPWKPITESHFSTPIQFLVEVNKFQEYIEQYFIREEIFGEFGEKFPIESYMRIYDMIKLPQSKLKFKCAYTRDGLGGWMNILALNESKAIGLYNNIKHIVSIENIDDFEERWRRREESLSRLRLLLASLSAKDQIYTSFSEMGCLQYLHFIEFSEAFAFEWHAAPRRKLVLTSISEIQKIYSDLKGSRPRFDFDEDKLENLLTIFKRDEDLKPSIVMLDNKCTIEWVEFHTHSGIFQRRYEIDKSLLPCKGLNDISDYAVPTNVRLVGDIAHLSMRPLFMY